MSGRAARRAALRAELLRLLDGLDVYREWRLHRLRRARPELTAAQVMGEVLAPREMFLEPFDLAGGVGGTGLVREVRTIYASITADLKKEAERFPDDAPDIAAVVRDMDAASGLGPDEAAAKWIAAAERALARGAIVSDAEFYALRDLEYDLELLPNELRAQLQALLDEYEASS